MQRLRQWLELRCVEGTDELEETEWDDCRRVLHQAASFETILENGGGQNACATVILAFCPVSGNMFRLSQPVSKSPLPAETAGTHLSLRQMRGAVFLAVGAGAELHVGIADLGFAADGAGVERFRRGQFAGVEALLALS